MLQPWMLPLTLLIGLFGTRSALHASRLVRTSTAAWWVVLSWIPMICWMASQVVVQG